MIEARRRSQGKQTPDEPRPAAGFIEKPADYPAHVKTITEVEQVCDKWPACPLRMPDCNLFRWTSLLPQLCVLA